MKKIEKRALYFENSYGEQRLLEESITEDEAFSLISDFCKIRSFSIPYVRYWEAKKGVRTYDVGSHTEFFYWKSIGEDI